MSERCLAPRGRGHQPHKVGSCIVGEFESSGLRGFWQPDTGRPASGTASGGEHTALVRWCWTAGRLPQGKVSTGNFGIYLVCK